MRGALALAFLLACGQSMAADWAYLTTSTTGDMVYMDSSSITSPSPSKRRAWTLYVGKGDETTKTFHAYDCPNRESAVISSVKHNAEGYVLENYTVPKPQYSPIVPDSIGETTFLAVCDVKQRAIMKKNSLRGLDPKIDAEMRRNPPRPASHASSEDHQGRSASKSSPDNCKGQCDEGYQWAQSNQIVWNSDCEGRGEFLRGCYSWTEDQMRRRADGL